MNDKNLWDLKLYNYTLLLATYIFVGHTVCIEQGIKHCALQKTNTKTYCTLHIWMSTWINI